MVYQFKRGSRLHGDAQKVGEELDKLSANHGGELTPEVVEKAGRRKSSALHGLFEWDDSAAALQYRLGQAAHIIRCVVVVDDEVVPATVSAYVRVEIDEESEDDEEPTKRSAYRHTADVMSDEQLRQQVVARALRELSAWRNRYKNYAELADVFEAIDRASAREMVMA